MQHPRYVACARPPFDELVASSLARSSSRIWVCSQSLSAGRATPSGREDPQGNQVFCQMPNAFQKRRRLRVLASKDRCMRTFPANITADDPVMVARSKYALSQFGFLSENCALWVNGHVAGGTATTVARRKSARQFLHYQRAGQGAITHLHLFDGPSCNILDMWHVLGRPLMNWWPRR